MVVRVKKRGEIVGDLEMVLTWDLKSRFQENSVFCALMSLYEVWCVKGRHRKQPSKILYVLQWLK